MSHLKMCRLSPTKTVSFFNFLVKNRSCDTDFVGAVRAFVEGDLVLWKDWVVAGDCVLCKGWAEMPAAN